MLHWFYFIAATAVLARYASGSEVTFPNDPPRCRVPPIWSLNGMDLMNIHAGKPIMVALIKLDCGQQCDDQLDGIRRLPEYIRDELKFEARDYKIAVITTENQRYELFDYWYRLFSEVGVVLLRETKETPVWEYLMGHNNDVYIYDRCGRMAYFIASSQSSISGQPFVVNGIFQVLKNTILLCGACTRESRVPISNIRAVIHTMTESDEVEDDYSRQEYESSKDYLEDDQHKPDADDDRRTTKAVSANQSTSTPNPSDYLPIPGSQSPYKGSYDNSYRGPDQGEPNGVNKGQLRTETATQPYEKDIYDYGSNGKRIKRPPVVDKGVQTDVSVEKESTTKSATSKEISKEIDEVEEEKMIKKETKPNVAGANKNSDGLTRKSISNKYTTTEPPVYWPPYAEECRNYSDYLCFLQQERIHSGESVGPLHDCCFKGIYMTNKCHPSVCGDDMKMLCCFQKFMQARYRCCNNAGAKCDSATDFSRCCYNIFAPGPRSQYEPYDECCPSDVAQQLWVNEKYKNFCMPNIHIDYEGITISGKTKHNEEITLKLGDAKQLVYPCQYSEKHQKCDTYTFTP